MKIIVFDIFSDICQKFNSADFMMNYSKAVKSQVRRSGVIQAIRSQAETELRRELSKDEERLLSTKFSLNLLLDRIQKVCNIT